MNLSAQAYIHANNQTYPKNSLFNAVADVMENDSWVDPLVDCEGRSYRRGQIAAIAESDEYAAHKARLAELGKTRD